MSEENFKISMSGAAVIIGLNSMNDMRLLFQLCYMMDSKNKIVLTSKRRKMICSNIKVGNSVLSRSMTSLKEAGVLSGEQGEFKIDPKYFWR